MPTTLGEAFSLARITEARFEDERSTIAIAKPNELTAQVHIQDLEQTTQRRADEPNRILLVMIHHMIYPIIVEVLHQKNYFSILNTEEADNTKPPLSADIFGNNGGDESETSVRELDNGYGEADTVKGL
ncbi:hypothetical protein Tco_0332345 [Tanacetum coccineum]